MLKIDLIILSIRINHAPHINMELSGIDGSIFPHFSLIKTFFFIYFKKKNTGFWLFLLLKLISIRALPLKSSFVIKRNIFNKVFIHTNMNYPSGRINTPIPFFIRSITQKNIFFISWIIFGSEMSWHMDEHCTTKFF